MKQLQNNFTTPEQSKRLLELGLPADSADCFYYESNWGINHNLTPLVINSDLKYNQLDLRDAEVSLPCWSVGRLMEIIKMCSTEEDWTLIVTTDNTNIVEATINGIIQNIDCLDFSKLE